MRKSYFDGESFESHGVVVERIHDDLPAMREEMEPWPGRHGSRVNSLTLDAREITLECRFLGDRWGDFESMKEDLAAWLVTDTDRRLQLRNHPGQYYMAHYASFSEGDRLGTTGIGGFELAFTAPDPIRFGEERAYVISDGEIHNVEIGGTEQADMRVTVRNARRDEGRKGVRVSFHDAGLEVPIPDTRAHTLTFDCVNHVATLDGKLTGVTLFSAWPRLGPGRFRCGITKGTGTVTLSWTQRYR